MSKEPARIITKGFLDLAEVVVSNSPYRGPMLIGLNSIKQVLPDSNGTKITFPGDTGHIYTAIAFDEIRDLILKASQ